MEIQYRYTRHQVARGSRPDAETFDALYLLKNSDELRATYQVRLLAFRALQQGKRLVVRVPKHTKLHASLRALRRSSGALIKIERV